MPRLLTFSLAALVFTAAGLGLRAGDADKSAGAVKLERLKWDEFLARVATNPKAKFTLVDAWATNCGPCKENFPHLVEMHHKYAKRGLAVVSLSLDDPSDEKAVREAEAFLREKKAVFRNVLLDEDPNLGYEKLEMNAIPAVFLYSPAGKLIAKFTMDDPDNQFTYEQVDRAVEALLKGEPLPDEKKADKK